MSVPKKRKSHSRSNLKKKVTTLMHVILCKRCKNPKLYGYICKKC